MKLLDIDNLKNISLKFKSDFDTLYEVNSIRKTSLNEITSKKLETHILNLKSHISLIEKEIDKNENSIIKLKKNKYEVLNESKSRIERKKLKREFYSLIGVNNLKPLLFAKDIYYLEYKSLSKVNRLLNNELQSNLNVLDKYLNTYIESVKKRNKSFNSLSEDIQNLLLSEIDNVESVADYLSDRRKDLFIVEHMESMKLVEGKELYGSFKVRGSELAVHAKEKSSNIYKSVKNSVSNFKSKLEEKNINEFNNIGSVNSVEVQVDVDEKFVLNNLSYDEGHPKIIVDVLNNSLLYIDSREEVNYSKDKNYLDIVLNDYKIRKKYDGNNVNFKVVKFLDDRYIPVYDSDDPGIWLKDVDYSNEDLKRDFIIKAYDFMDNI